MEIPFIVRLQLMFIAISDDKSPSDIFKVIFATIV